MMFNKFKNKSIVCVTGYGKCNSQQYKNKIGTIIGRDPYFLDYNIKFEDGTEDWIDEIYLEKLKGD